MKNINTRGFLQGSGLGEKKYHISENIWLKEVYLTFS